MGDLYAWQRNFIKGKPLKAAAYWYSVVKFPTFRRKASGILLPGEGSRNSTPEDGQGEGSVPCSGLWISFLFYFGFYREQPVSYFQTAPHSFRGKTPVLTATLHGADQPSRPAYSLPVGGWANENPVWVLAFY